MVEVFDMDFQKKQLKPFLLRETKLLGAARTWKNKSLKAFKMHAAGLVADKEYSQLQSIVSNMRHGHSQSKGGRTAAASDHRLQTQPLTRIMTSTATD